MQKIINMPKIECPFVRKEINGKYLVINEINPGYEWVFEDDSVMAIEKLHGTMFQLLFKKELLLLFLTELREFHS